MRHQEDVRILLCADTHLGFDEPVRPRVERRRRGTDFFDNFQRVLDSARDRRADLVIHGGDLFFRSRVPPSIVDRVYRMLLRFAAHGIPILIVPGNHERSVLPSSLFLSHPNIHVFTQPETQVFDIMGTRIAVTGIPCARDGVRRQFRSLLARTDWAEAACDARFLCLHQAIEGAQVGPSNFTFRSGDDVIPIAELPSAFDAVLAGHIHRAQTLFHRRPDGTSMPVIYPGSTERTSFAEMHEPKGYFWLTVGGSPDNGQRRRMTYEFVPLPARPMHKVVLGPGLNDTREARAFLKPRLAMLVDEVRRRAPEGPGVYLFRGDRDEILYVGKAVNLKQRLLSHLRLDPLADPQRHSRMVYEVRDFEFQTTASELLALLREDELIKRHRPRFNIRQNEFLAYQYLELTADQYPRLRMVDHETALGSRQVFGPYRDRYFVDDVLGLIHDHLGLRSCSGADPVDRCFQFDLGHCAGPCRSGISPRDYEQVIARTVAFLGGDVSEVAARLREAMGSSSERLDYEKAQELKERLGFCHRFGERQRFLAAFRKQRLVVVERGDPSGHPEGRPALVYEFQQGRLTTNETLTAHGTAVEPAAVDDDPRFLLDRAAIVHGWLHRNSERCRYSFDETPHP
jgi:DNA repair protein SbcD/Mre11